MNVSSHTNRQRNRTPMYVACRHRLEFGLARGRVFSGLRSWTRPALLIGFYITTLFAQTNVLTYHNDNARTGQNITETILKLSNVNSAAFGKLFFLPVDGKVDGQPLYVSDLNISGATRNVLYVVTEHDSVYAFDADNGVMLWHVSLLLSGETPSDDRGCPQQLTPEIGITGTPVIDLTGPPNGILYAVAMSKDTSAAYHHRLHALDITTGSELLNGPVEIQATFSGTGDNSVSGQVIFDPSRYKERSALLLLNNVIYTGWASHCETRPYTGWVIGYDARTLAQTSILNTTANGWGGAVWSSGAGPAADALGNVYLLLADGTFDTTLNANGFPQNGDFGNAFVKLSNISNVLQVADYFTMSAAGSENNTNEDLGSGGALVLPDMLDSTGRTRHLAIGAGKDGNIYLVDRDNMGKFNTTSDNIYQELIGALSPEFSMPAYFNNKVYFAARNDSLKAFQFNAAILSSAVSTSATLFSYPGATPSISANGTTDGIVWALENTSPSVLHAYDSNDLSRELYNSSQAASSRDQFGSTSKFIPPTVINGKVYVPTTTGVAVFGLLSVNVPTAPGNPALSNPTTSSLTFSWTPATSSVGIAGYRIDLATNLQFTTFVTGYAARNVGNVTSFIMSGLPAGTSFFARVRAYDTAGSTGPNSAVVQGATQGAADTTPPTAPGAPSLGNATTTSLTLTWSAATDNVGVAGYRIDVATDSGFAFRVSGYSGKPVGNVTSTNITGLSAGTTYYARVRAYDVAGNTGPNSPTATGSTTGQLDTSPPTAPNNPLISNPTNTSLLFTWEPALDNVGVVGYVTDTATDNAFTNMVMGYGAKKVGNSTSLMIGGLNPGTTYYARVRAYDAAGNIGPNSNVVQGTTTGSVDTSPPTAPASASLNNPTNTSLTLNWTAATDNVSVAGYRIDVATDSAFASRIPGYAGKTVGNVLSTVISGLSPGATYYARVRAYDGAGNTGPNSPSTTGITLGQPDTSPPSAPSNALLSNPTSNSLLFSWKAASDNVGVAGYRIDVSTSPVFTTFVTGYAAKNVGNVLTVTISGLTPTTTYYARVRAYDLAGNTGSNSTPAQGTTGP